MMSETSTFQVTSKQKAPLINMFPHDSYRKSNWSQFIIWFWESKLHSSPGCKAHFLGLAHGAEMPRLLESNGFISAALFYNTKNCDKTNILTATVKKLMQGLIAAWFEIAWWIDHGADPSTSVRVIVWWWYTVCELNSCETGRIMLLISWKLQI